VITRIRKRYEILRIDLICPLELITCPGAFYVLTSATVR
jgi:hypothetical protein